LLFLKGLIKEFADEARFVEEELECYINDTIKFICKIIEDHEQLYTEEINSLKDILKGLRMKGYRIPKGVIEEEPKEGPEKSKAAKRRDRRLAAPPASSSAAPPPSVLAWPSEEKQSRDSLTGARKHNKSIEDEISILIGTNKNQQELLNKDTEGFNKIKATLEETKEYLKLQLTSLDEIETKLTKLKELIQQKIDDIKKDSETIAKNQLFSKGKWQNKKHKLEREVKKIKEELNTKADEKGRALLKEWPALISQVKALVKQVYPIQERLQKADQFEKGQTIEKVCLVERAPQLDVSEDNIQAALVEEAEYKERLNENIRALTEQAKLLKKESLTKEKITRQISEAIKKEKELLVKIQGDIDRIEITSGSFLDSVDKDLGSTIRKHAREKDVLETQVAEKDNARKVKERRQAPPPSTSEPASHQTLPKPDDFPKLPSPIIEVPPNVPVQRRSSEGPSVPTNLIPAITFYAAFINPDATEVIEDRISSPLIVLDASIPREAALLLTSDGTGGDGNICLSQKYQYIGLDEQPEENRGYVVRKVDIHTDRAANRVTEKGNEPAMFWRSQFPPERSYSCSQEEHPMPYF